MVFYNPSDDIPDPWQIARKLEDHFEVFVNFQRGKDHARHILEEMKENGAADSFVEPVEEHGDRWVIIEVRSANDELPLLIQPDTSDIYLAESEMTEFPSESEGLRMMVLRISKILGFTYDDQC